MIEKLIETVSTALVGNKFLPIPLKISFHVRKRSVVSDSSS